MLSVYWDNEWQKSLFLSLRLSVFSNLYYLIATCFPLFSICLLAWDYKFFTPGHLFFSFLLPNHKAATFLLYTPRKLPIGLSSFPIISKSLNSLRDYSGHFTYQSFLCLDRVMQDSQLQNRKITRRGRWEEKKEFLTQQEMESEYQDLVC